MKKNKIKYILEDAVLYFALVLLFIGVGMESMYFVGAAVVIFIIFFAYSICTSNNNDLKKNNL